MQKYCIIAHKINNKVLIMAEKTYFTLSDNFNGLPKPQPAEDTRKVFELAYVSLDVTQGTEEDEQKLTRVINRLAKDKNAREILERIEEKGVITSYSIHYTKLYEFFRPL